MIQKVRKITDRNGVEQVGFTCPGCEFDHILPLRRPAEGHGSTGPCWNWNGSEESPTITPSILATAGRGGDTPDICHSFVTDGKIQFLSDCTHKLTGQTVDLPEVDQDFISFWCS